MIGTAAAIAIGLGSAAATAGSSIYASKRAADVNEEAIRAQARAEAEERRQQEIARKERMEFERQRWADYVRANTPYWQVGQRVYGNLLDLAGVDPSTLPPMAMPSADAPPPELRDPAAGPPNAAAARMGGPAAAPRPMPTRSAQPPVAGRVPARRIVPPMTAPQLTRSTSLMDLMQLASLASGPSQVSSGLPATAWA